MSFVYLILYRKHNYVPKDRKYTRLGVTLKLIFSSLMVSFDIEDYTNRLMYLLKFYPTQSVWWFLLAGFRKKHEKRNILKRCKRKKMRDRGHVITKNEEINVKACAIETSSSFNFVRFVKYCIVITLYRATEQIILWRAGYFVILNCTGVGYLKALI